MGLGTILVNFPGTGVLDQVVGGQQQHGVLQILFEIGIETELFPLLIFIGIGAMIDFGPLLQNPFMLLFGAAAQFGIFFVVVVAVLFGFDIREAASIGIIGAADGPTSIFVANQLALNYLERLRLRPTHTWRLFRLSNQSLSRWLQQKQNVVFV